MYNNNNRKENIKRWESKRALHSKGSKVQYQLVVYISKFKVLTKACNNVSNITFLLLVFINYFLLVNYS